MKPDIELTFKGLAREFTALQAERDALQKELTELKENTSWLKATNTVTVCGTVEIHHEYQHIIQMQEFVFQLKGTSTRGLKRGYFVMCVGEITVVKEKRAQLQVQRWFLLGTVDV